VSALTLRGTSSIPKPGSFNNNNSIAPSLTLLCSPSLPPSLFASLSQSKSKQRLYTQMVRRISALAVATLKDSPRPTYTCSINLQITQFKTFLNTVCT
jgi:hypothetical protein